MTRRWWLLLVILAGLAMPAAARQAPAQPGAEPSAALRAGAEHVLALLRGQAEPAQIFTAGFLADVPEPQVRAITRQFDAQYGAVRRIAGIDAQSPTMGAVHVETERATLHLDIVVEPGPPHRITGLLLTGVDLSGDSAEAILADLRALPGEVSFAAARLGEGTPAMVAAHEPGRALAIGSAYKLWILAELSRQVKAGERRWSDVVAIDQRSLPGGTLYHWPRGAPVTLHTLASLMISISDNSATDLLLHVLGRESVERMMTTIGVSAAARNRPLLATLEMSAIKTAPAPALEAWRRADEAGRRALLATAYGGLEPGRVDIGRFSGNPLNLDVEWFASAADLVATMDWLRRHGDETALAILAINAGVPSAQRAGFAYVGYKGGSEPGVLNLTWLVRNRAGQWRAITGSWNNPSAPVDEQRFAALMARAAQLAR